MTRQSWSESSDEKEETRSEGAQNMNISMKIQQNPTPDLPICRLRFMGQEAYAANATEKESEKPSISRHAWQIKS
jgi:hypothetical protein